MTTLPRSAGAIALAAFLAASPALAADPSPIPARGADEIGPRVIDLGGPAPGQRAPAGDTTTRFFVHNPAAVQADQVGYAAGGYPGLWTGDGTFSRRGHHAFLNRAATIGSTGTTAGVSFRGPRHVFPGGGIASPGISNFTPKVGVRSSVIIGNFRR